PANDISVRAAYLLDSFQRLDQVCSTFGTHARVLSLSRVAADLGYQEIAVHATSGIVAELAAGRPMPIPEPLLPLAESYENTDAGDLSALMVGMVLATYGRRKYMSVNGHADFMAMIEHTINLGGGTPELERGRQLFRMAAGLQAKPELTPLLSA